jgi:RHS repeat-associated protein
MKSAARTVSRPSTAGKRRSILAFLALLGGMMPVATGFVTGVTVARASGSGGTVPIPTTSNVVTESSSTAPATGTSQWIFLPDPGLGTVPTLVTSGEMQMTNNTGNQDGYAYWNQPLTPTFLTASFDLSIGGGSGADGMSFSLADASSPGRGSYTCCGADLGFGGGTGLGVQFDTYQNGGCDPSANFVGVAEYSSSNTYGCTHVATTSSLPVSLRQYPGQLLAQVEVAWVPSPSVTIWLNGAEVLSTSVPSLPSSVLVGFGGGTGGLNDYHRVSNIQIGYSQQQSPTGGAVDADELYGSANCACTNAVRAQGHAADPVDTAYGNFSETYTDLSIPGRGVPLAFTRTYNAQAAAAGTNGPLGYGWTSNYAMSLSQPGGSGTPVTIDQEGGAEVVFDQSGSSFTPAAPRDIATLSLSGSVWTFTRDGQDSYTFNSSGQLTSETDLNGYTTTLTYSSGELSTVTDQAGRTLTIAWTGTHITSVTDNNVTPNRTATFGYNDGNGNLTDVVDVNGGHTHFTYDPTHRLTNLYDPVCYAAGSSCDSGNGVFNVYDSSNRITSQKDDLGRTTMFAYAGSPGTSAGGTTTVTDPLGNVTYDVYQYGLLVSETKGYGTAAAATSTYEYDPDSLGLVLETDPNGNTTTYTVDASGNQLSSLDPLGRTTSATYNAFNEPLTKEDGNGITTTYTYNSDGDMTSASTPLVGTMPLQHQVTDYYHADSAHPGDVTSMKDPDLQTWTYTYDSYGDQQTLEDPLGDTATTCYNPDGWKTATYTPLAGSITCANPPPASAYRTLYSYALAGGGTDELGDVQKLTDPLGHTAEFTYDANRNLLSQEDGDSNVTTYVYDLDNEQTKIERADSPQTTLTTDYNSDGTVHDQKDGKNNPTLTYGYDALGRVISEEDADSNVTTFARDSDGNVLSIQAPGGNCATGTPVGCISDTYDADDELTSVVYSDGVTPNVSNLTYDCDGRRLTMTDGTGTTTDVYDSLGRLTSEQNGAGITIGYGYDLKSQMTSISYPGSHAVTYGYDNAGRLTTVADWLGNTTTYTPNANSFDTGIAYQNGVNVTQTPNDSNQNMGITAKVGATTLASMTYARDGNNQITGESDTGVTQVAQPFTYTALNQVKAAGSNSYGYDAADNLTKLTSGGNQYFDAADELCWMSTGTGTSCGSAPSGATTYTYDTNGDRTKSTQGLAVVNYGYDEANRLTSYASASQSATYAYDGDGLRMTKTVNGTTTHYTWDTAGSTPLLLSDGTVDYIYGINGTPIEQQQMRPAISLVGEATGSGGTSTASITVNFPSGYQVGDQIYVATTQSNTTTVTPPSTYSMITSVSSGGSSPVAGTSLYRHTVATGESSVTIAYSGTSSVKGIILADYRGVDSSLPVDVVNKAGTAAGTTVVAPSVAPLYPNDRLLVFQGARGTFSSKSWTAPSGMTEQGQINSQANVSTGLADLVLSATGSTGTKTSTFGASANLTTIIVAVPQPPSVLYYQTDQLESTRLLTDSAGVVRGTFSYDAYGNEVGATGSYSSPLGYAGQYEDAESGLIYLRARYYDPVTAQFLTRDPALASTRDPYGYIADNPLNGSDPSGKEGYPLTASGNDGPTRWQYYYDPSTQLLHYTATNDAVGSFTITVDRNGNYEWLMQSHTGPIDSYDLNVGSHTNTSAPWFSFVNPFNSAHVFGNIAIDSGTTELPRTLAGDIDIEGVFHTWDGTTLVRVHLPNPEQWPDWLTNYETSGCSSSYASI